jgi:hypothetical protein
MRDFRDAKVMAHALRDALKVKTVEITHSESLKLIANAFGYANWNILSAKIEAAEPGAGAQEPARPKTLYCVFCGRSQHEVKKLIAGPSAYICDECVELCVDIIREEGNFDKIFSPLRADEESGDPAYATAFHVVRGASSEELQDVLEHGRRGVERHRRALQGIERRLAMRASEDLRGDDLLALPEFAYLKSKPRDELLALQRAQQVALKRYEEGLRIAMTVLAERGEQAG